MQLNNPKVSLTFYANITFTDDSETAAMITYHDCTSACDSEHGFIDMITTKANDIAIACNKTIKNITSLTNNEYEIANAKQISDGYKTSTLGTKTDTNGNTTKVPVAYNNHQAYIPQTTCDDNINFDPATQIALIWSIDDILSDDIAPYLSRKQAKAVLDDIKRHHDCSVGVSWDTLIATAQAIFPDMDFEGKITSEQFIEINENKDKDHNFTNPGELLLKYTKDDAILRLYENHDTTTKETFVYTVEIKEANKPCVTTTEKGVSFNNYEINDFHTLIPHLDKIINTRLSTANLYKNERVDGNA